MAYEYRFLIDWSGDDALGRADRVSASGLKTDITEDVIRCEVKLGRDDTDVLAGVSSGGTFRATVNNYESIYNPYGWVARHGSALAPLPGRDITVVYRKEGTTVWKRLWRGFLVDIRPDRTNVGRSTVEINGESGLAYVQRRGYSIAFDIEKYPDQFTAPPFAGTVIYDILSTIPASIQKPIWPTSRRKGWNPDGTGGHTRIDVSKLFDALGSGVQLVNPYSVIQQLVKSEFGYIFDDREGNINFWDRYRRVARAGGSFLVSELPTITDNIATSINPTGNELDNIYNRAVSDTAQYQVFHDELISNVEKEQITSGTSVEFEYTGEDFNPELESGEFINNIHNIEVEVEPDITFVVTSRYYKQRLTILVSNLPGTHAVKVTVKSVSVRTVKQFEQFDLTGENPTSINTFGVKEYRYPARILWADGNPARQNADGVPLDIVAINSYLDFIANIYGSLTRSLNVDYHIANYDGAIDLSIGDILFVNSEVNDIQNQRYFIESEKHSFDNKGQFNHRVSLVLIEAENYIIPWNAQSRGTNLSTSSLYF